jgi:hypothetical protein
LRVALTTPGAGVGPVAIRFASNFLEATILQASDVVHADKPAR